MSIDRRILLRGALACACCAKAGAAIALDAPAHGGAVGAHWSYEGEGGPEKWGELQPDFKVCQLGLEQTPIDLGNGIKGDVGSVEYDYKPVALRIVNNGHTIKVNADPGSACVIGGTRYELLQFHFHHPSEHLLAGKDFDLECHFVHKASTGALAVTGVFIRPGAASKALATFFELDACQGRPGGAGRQHDRCRSGTAEEWRLFPLYGLVDDAALLGRPDLDGPQGAGRGIGRTDPEICDAVSEQRASGSEAQPSLSDRRFLIDAPNSFISNRKLNTVSKPFSSTVNAPSGLFGFFTNRKINAKIMIGFAVVLALLAVLSAISYRGFGNVSTGFETFRQRVTVVGIVRDIDREFVALRRLRQRVRYIRR